MAVRGQTLTINDPTELITEDCCNCGALFAMTKAFRDARLRDHKSFYCPAGHSMSYTGKSDAQKLREANEAHEVELRAANARLQAERDQRLAAQRELKRHKQRTQGGACPCCNRTFVQLARHMKTKHPGFTAEAGQ